MNSKRNTYTAAIIGAGRIGTGFDGPDASIILTHAHALKKNQRTKLAAIVDTDAACAVRESKRWSVPSFTSVEEMFQAVHPDIVIIAAPDATHAALLLQIEKLKPKLIICEKPAVQDAQQAKSVRALHVPVLVNYTRRFDPVMRTLSKQLSKGAYGKIISVSATYSGDLRHNGIHAIDLTRFLVGEIADLPQFHLIHGDQSAYSIFEVDILASKMRIRIFDRGFQISMQPAVSDPVFKGFRSLGKATVKKTGYLKALPELVKNAVAVLDGTSEPIVPLAEALKSEQTVFAIAKWSRGK